MDMSEAMYLFAGCFIGSFSTISILSLILVNDYSIVLISNKEKTESMDIKKEEVD